ncbi:MAG TPA: DUF4369 domain-containing protein, partial [Chitinophagaceae bacterium]|nr:DUF4369 domain-containing protein [Chitinophagaceae bacterium]
MPRFFIFILALLPLLGNTQINSIAPDAAVSRSEEGFRIMGEISGLQKGATVRLINANTGMELASGIVQEKLISTKKNGKTTSTARPFFVLKGKMPEPDLCQLAIGELSPYNIYVENAKISITGAAAAANKWVVKGSASHRDFQHFEAVFTPLAMQLNSTAATINSMSAGSNRDSLMKIYANTQKTIQ